MEKAKGKEKEERLDFEKKRHKKTENLEFHIIISKLFECVGGGKEWENNKVITISTWFELSDVVHKINKKK